MTRMVALLRGINVGGRVLPMAALRALCGEIGWRDVETYIQSGNVVFAADRKPAALEAALEGERVGRAGDGLWIDFPTGIAASKLSPLQIDKLVDFPATSRNYRTVIRLKEMLER